MIIGLVKEIKKSENRIGLTPKRVKEFVDNGHQVLVERNAGRKAGFKDEEYLANGAKIHQKAKTIWDMSDMIIKVKEPIESEFKYFKKGLIIYTFLHLAANKALTNALVNNGVTSIAYETISENNTLTCLKPMSEIAGRLSVLEGSGFLFQNNGGKGILISGAEGAPAANVLIIGAGTVGSNALKNAYGLGANITVLDINQEQLNYLLKKYPKIKIDLSNEENIKKYIKEADLIISGVLLPGAKAPKLIKNEYYKLMKKNSVIVDVAVDQGGITDYSRPTSHQKPTFKKEGIIHYCVPNMPGIVPKTATKALSHATYKYGLLIANNGLEKALKASSGLREGLNTYHGHITYKKVADAFNLKYHKYA